MRTLRTTRLSTAYAGIGSLAGLALLTGCFSTGPRDAHGRDRDPYRDRDRVSAPAPSDDEHRVREVRGTVERVDPVNHRIVVAEGERIEGRDEPRDGERSGRLSIYYEPSIRPGQEPPRFRPQDLRRGDRIRAEVETTPGGLMIQQLEVLARADGGPAPEIRETPEDRRAPEVRESPDVREAPREVPDAREAPGVRESPELRDDSPRVDHLRGTVRYVDTSARTVEIETPSGQGRTDLVRVQYDDDTNVEAQGKHYSPENLQLGNRVEIDLRDGGGGHRLLAQRIVVVSGGRTENQ
jgi:hypothetical protein